MSSVQTWLQRRANRFWPKVRSVSPRCLASAIVSTCSCQKSQCIAFQMINFSSKTRSWQSLLDLETSSRRCCCWIEVVSLDVRRHRRGSQTSSRSTQFLFFFDKTTPSVFLPPIRKQSLLSNDQKAWQACVVAAAVVAVVVVSRSLFLHFGHPWWKTALGNLIEFPSLLARMDPITLLYFSWLLLDKSFRFLLVIHLSFVAVIR